MSNKARKGQKVFMVRVRDGGIITVARNPDDLHSERPVALKWLSPTLRRTFRLPGKYQVVVLTSKRQGAIPISVHPFSNGNNVMRGIYLCDTLCRRAGILEELKAGKEVRRWLSIRLVKKGIGPKRIFGPAGSQRRLWEILT